MSDSPIVRAGGPWIAVWLSCCLFCSPARAQDPEDKPLRPTLSWSDPLLAEPPALALGGTVLPGDTQLAPCAALPAPDASLSLAEAVDLALCHDTRAGAAWAEIKAQSAALGEARSAYLPSINASVNRLHDRTNYPGSRFNSSDIYSTTNNASVAWRLFDFGARNANHRAAQAWLDAAVLSYDATLQKTLSTVIDVYVETRRSWLSWKLFEQSETSARQTMEAAQRREDAGYGARSDTLQAKAALAKVSLAKSRAQGEFRKNSASLLFQTGLAAGTALRFEDDIPVADAAWQADLDQWLTQAQEQHPAIRAAQAQLAGAMERETAARDEGKPTVDFSLNIYQNGRPNQGLSSTSTREMVVGVALNIPIFDGFSRTYKVRGAQAQVELKQQALEEARRQVTADLLKAHAQANAVLANLALSAQLLAAAQDALASVHRKFERGAADIVEVLGAQTSLIDAQQERTRCTSEWLAARLQLFAAAGQLGRARL